MMKMSLMAVSQIGRPIQNQTWSAESWSSSQNITTSTKVHVPQALNARIHSQPVQALASEDAQTTSVNTNTRLARQQAGITAAYGQPLEHTTAGDLTEMTTMSRM